ncbi:hypothetical protein J6590_090693, partial [Homalodisca vitripennis]
MFSSDLGRLKSKPKTEEDEDTFSDSLHSKRLVFMLFKDWKCSYCHLPYITSQSVTARGSFSCFKDW